MEKQLVIFKLGGECYGLDIATVESIIKLQPVTAVPFTPACVEGVINLRGVVLPVVDLRRRLGLPTVEPGKETRIVIVELEPLTVGLVVDAVSEVLRIPDTAIEPPPPLAVTVDASFITGIARVGEQLIILLDLDQVLAYQEGSILSSLQPA